MLISSMWFYSIQKHNTDVYTGSVLSRAPPGKVNQPLSPYSVLLTVVINLM